MSRLKRVLRIIGIVVLCLAVPVVVLFAVFMYNNRPPNITVPTHSVPKDNGWGYFVRAAEIAGKVKHFGPVSDPDPKHVWTFPEYESFIRDNASAFAMLREGLEHECVAPPLRTFERSEDTIDLYGRFREEGRMLCSEGQYYEFIHRPANSVYSRLDCMEFGVVIQNGGSLVTGLVGACVEDMGRSHVELLIPRLNAQELSRAASRLQRIQMKRAAFSSIEREEGYSLVAEMADACQRARQSFSPGSWVAVDPETGVSRTWATARYAFCNKAAALREQLAYYEAVAEEQKGAYRGVSHIYIPHNGISDLAGMIPICESRVVFENKAAATTILQTEIALRRYLLDNGHYPTDLDQLATKYLKTIPIDPFGLGKPLRYELKGNDYLLYSLGPDLKDDGGRPGACRAVNDTGDLVAGHLMMKR